MERRGISREEVDWVIKSPEEVVAVRPGRIVCQSRIEEKGKWYLLRVFVDVDRVPAQVVTVYKASKVGKYFGGSP